MPVEQRRTQEQRRSTAKAALLAAAAELVVEQGTRALTLAKVAERAGYSRGIVTHHFGSKPAMIDELARWAQGGFTLGLKEQPPGLEHLVLLVERYIARSGDEGAPGKAFLLLWAEALTTPELAPMFRERDRAFRGEIREDVAAGVKEATIRADVDPAGVSVAVLGQLRGIWMQHLLDRDAVDTRTLGRAVADQWRRALTNP